MACGPHVRENSTLSPRHRGPPLQHPRGGQHAPTRGAVREPQVHRRLRGDQRRQPEGRARARLRAARRGLSRAGGGPAAAHRGDARARRPLRPHPRRPAGGARVGRGAPGAARALAAAGPRQQRRRRPKAARDDGGVRAPRRQPEPGAALPAAAVRGHPAVGAGHARAAAKFQLGDGARRQARVQGAARAAPRPRDGGLRDAARGPPQHGEPELDSRRAAAPAAGLQGPHQQRRGRPARHLQPR
mmetsp:Transcript_25056/g.78559  ORF Transcript_25056/g.78559 Transcript_25056/m.78559 type:complete len:244 (+) Transcript_25056:395-1126(+)